VEDNVMQIEQTQWRSETGWSPAAPGRLGNATMLFIFGSTALLKNTQQMRLLREAYPSAYLLGCSTAGEIIDTQVCDDSLTVTAVQFEDTTIHGTNITLKGEMDSYQAGKWLANHLPEERLAHVFVLSDGLKVNGSELVAGMSEHLPAQVTITGGLAGDGTRFRETLVVGDAAPSPDTIAALGFYGNRLRIGYGSLGGWDTFGPERLITSSKGNVLYELDGTSALELYKTYLGNYAAELPASALLFPLSVRLPDAAMPVVRTVLAVSDEHGTMTFAGDLPEGAYARFMKANFDRLVIGAASAAMTSYEAIGSTSPDLALLISCVGRKLVLKQRIEEEVEEVRQVLGKKTTLAGFYSYGEISPFTPGSKCELHNQTMTITTFAEF
jgi:hypothetical protein